MDIFMIIGIGAFLFIFLTALGIVIFWLGHEVGRKSALIEVEKQVENGVMYLSGVWFRAEGLTHDDYEGTFALQVPSDPIPLI